MLVEIVIMREYQFFAIKVLLSKKGGATDPPLSSFDPFFLAPPPADALSSGLSSFIGVRQCLGTPTSTKQMVTFSAVPND